MRFRATKWIVTAGIAAVLATGQDVAVASMSAVVAVPPVASVIPLPALIEARPGQLVIHDSTSLSAPRDPQVEAIARYLAELLATTPGISLQIVPQRRVRERGGGPQGIILELRPHRAELPADPEGYALDVSSHGAVLAARDIRGLRYAAITLWQLCTAGRGSGGTVTIPAVHIRDWPRFSWRGLLLDSARHFQSPQFIARLVDWMALHKLNVLHWHLTDDQGWRLEIKKYPRLTEVGAWRVPAGAAAAANIDPATGRPRLYGGYYSQDTVRQLVAHANERNVTIVPEIDLPGHATAALVAYPSLASRLPVPAAVPSDWGVYENLFNPEEETFRFFENVLSEVTALFPGMYVHVGGDEAVKDQWKDSPRIQVRMHQLGLTNEGALQSYFVRRM